MFIFLRNARIIIFVFLLAPPWCWQSASALERKRNQPPNIVVILADDMGVESLSSYGSEIQTPNLDSLAREGIQLLASRAATTEVLTLDFLQS